MLFKVASYHPSTDGGVLPKVPLFIEASTWFNGRRVIGSHLGVPSDHVILKVHEGPIPEGSEKLDESKPGEVQFLPVSMVA